MVIWKKKLKKKKRIPTIIIIGLDKEIELMILTNIYRYVSELTD